MPPSAKSPESKETIRILIVDSDEVVGELLRHYLETTSRAYTVLSVVVDTMQVLENFRVAKPNLVITNSSLHSKSAAAMIETMRAQSPSIKVVVFSNAHPACRSFAETAEVDPDGMIHRSETLATFEVCLTSVLCGGHFLSPRCTAIKKHQRREPDPFRDLSPVELKIFQLIGQGELQKVIGDDLGISCKSVQRRVATIKQKLGLPLTANLIEAAARHDQSKS